MLFLPASQKRLLNSLNPLFVVFLVFGLILVRTTMDPLLPDWFRKSEILLPIIVYIGQRRPPIEGVILTLFTSHLYSLCSAAPIGVFTSQCLIIFVLSRLLSYVTYATSWIAIMLMLLALNLVWELCLYLVAASFGHAWPLFPDGFSSIGKWFFNGILGYFVYASLGLVDRMSFKSPSANIELSKGEL